MKKSWLVARLGLVGIFGAAAAATGGCGGDGDPNPTGPSIAAICEKMCECKDGCSESEQKDCVEEGERLEKKSDEGGCPDTWVEYKECLDENMVCTASGPDPASCEVLTQELGACWVKTEDACEDLAADVNGFYQQCGVAQTPTPIAECTDARITLLNCRLGCLTEASSCDAISEEDPEGAAVLNQCLSGCEPAP